MTAVGWPDAGETAGVAEVLDIGPGAPLVGRLRVPGDKSVSHRALLLGARADGISIVRGLSNGDDVRRTALAVRAMGAGLEATAPPAGAGPVPPGIPEVAITGGVTRLHEPEGVVDVGNSGTTMRLLAGWTAAYPWFAVLTGDRSILRRPVDRVAEPLRRMGARVDGREEGRLPPLAIRGGRLTGIEYRMPVASAQVKSAVLLAGLGATSPTSVHEPAPTRSHTEEMLASCGAEVAVSNGGRTVQIRPSVLRPFTLDVPGDPSQAAFWIVAACIVAGSDITVEGVYVGRARAGFLDVLGRMGADIDVAMRDATTADIRARSSALRATSVGGDEVAGLIDEIPVLAVAAAFADGTTTFRDAGELAVKETNRIATVTSELGALGVRVEPLPDGLRITGGAPLHGDTVQSHGDHRVGMAMAVAALGADGPSRVEGWEAVATSYPGFGDDLARLRS